LYPCAGDVSHAFGYSTRGQVIMPSFTFVSTANAFVGRGAKPIFADITTDTLNIDPESVRKLTTSKTKVIVPVHYAGISCDMEQLCQIATDNNLQIVEDNAHGLFGKYRGKFLGTFGTMATQSFHETKNFHCGEGGALIINDETLVERAEIIREKGTNRNKFFRGQVDKYSWVDEGSSYLPSDILAALLLAQLEEREQIQNRRKLIWEEYMEKLIPWASSLQIGLPCVPIDREPAYHLFYLLLPSLQERQRLIQHLKDFDINAVYHYVPLHTSDMGTKFGFKKGDCPITEDVSERLVRLPMYNGMTDSALARVISSVKAFKPLGKTASVATLK
jgi:Predicted pyridoxal phosphate-dependent enzyme apparently involved in regulation of cell wall biogenesis